MDATDTARLESLKRGLRQNEEALARSIFPGHAESLRQAIESQKRAITRLEAQA